MRGLCERLTISATMRPLWPAQLFKQDVGAMDIPIVFGWVEPQRSLRVLWQNLLAWAGIALLTYCGFVLRVNLTTISSLFLLVVVAMASFCGFWQASLTSILAVACLDYFFMPPVLRLNITDQQDWMALLTFEVTALVISRL